MKSGSSPKSSTLHVRNFRARMREQGLVKKDVWIRPEHASELQAIEQRLRAPDSPMLPAPPPAATHAWTVVGIRDALQQSSLVAHGLIGMELIEGAEPSLRLVLREFGDLSVFLAVGGEQIVVEAYLWPASQVRDVAAFNAHVLRTHKLLPLSSISLQDVAGMPGYTMSGALDTHSSLSSLLFEIETLADNVLTASEAYAGFLESPPGAGDD